MVSNVFRILGMLLWVDAFESLAVFGIVAVFFFSIGTEPKHRLVSKAKEQSADGSATDVARVTVQPTFRRRFVSANEWRFLDQ